VGKVAPGLIGRESEVVQLRGRLDGAPEHGAVVLIRGAAGIGKTSLLGAAVADARSRGFRVLTMTGIESEAHLPYAGLHQLLQPVIAQVENLPPPQKSALKTALGTTADEAPEMFLVAMATLNLIEDAAGDGPIVVSADDIQWLDFPTTSVLTFIARRVEPTNMLILAAIRDGYDSLLVTAGVPELRLDALGEAASRELLDAVAPGLAGQVRQRVLDEAEGNPLALIELPRALDQPRRAAERGLHLTDRLERAFSARAASLPETTQSALLLAALDEGPSLSEVLAATRLLLKTEPDVDILMPAVDAALITLDEDQIRFRHPLIRSALEQAALPGRRRDGHRAMASVIANPDRRAWHRAAAVLGTDDEAAGELEATAARANSRGATAIALRALELAANLTSQTSTRVRRLLAAAEIGLQLGQPATVSRLLGVAAKLDMTPNDHARMTWLREILNEVVPADASAVVKLVKVAREMAAAGDRHLALNLLRVAALRCWYVDPGQAARESLVQAIDEMDPDESDVQALEILSIASPIDAGARVANRIAKAALADDGDATRLLLLGTAAHAVVDLNTALALLKRAAPALRAQGKLGLLAGLLDNRARVEIQMGLFTDAARDAEEAHGLLVETEQPVRLIHCKSVMALLAGVRGEEALAEQLSADAEAAALSIPLRAALAAIEFGRGLTAVTAGRHSDAFDHLARLFDPNDAAFEEVTWCEAAGYAVECGVRADRVEEARQIMIRLETLGKRTPSALLHMGLRYARAVLADESAAETLYDIALKTEPRWPFDYARLQMSYGRWLRRQRRIIESRPFLRAARETFEALGVHPWANMARAELRASGERITEPAKAPHPALSPQELQVAQMASSGLSNREIGDRLFLSHRTVGAHLYRIYPKLGIASRSELAGALAAHEPALPE
jgi:DNA-binding CsgD family transcriptional regulator/tetratricopeptide (TPR) repeat protein